VRMIRRGSSQQRGGILDCYGRTADRRCRPLPIGQTGWTGLTAPCSRHRAPGIGREMIARSRDRVLRRLSK